MNIAATGFSHRGTIRKKNEDAILMHSKVFQSGTHQLEVDGIVRFFVADGVGGAPAGEVASKFVLDKLNENFDQDAFPDHDTMIKNFRGINASMFEFCNLNPQYSGMASTLSGVFISGQQYRMFNAGDSCTFIFRDQKLEKLTNSGQVELYPESSLLTNYFGGFQDSLSPKALAVSSELKSDDIFVISTDGLFHCFPVEQLEKILSNNKPLHEKARMILEKSLDMGAPDNISCIFIKIS